MTLLLSFLPLLKRFWPFIIGALVLCYGVVSVRTWGAHKFDAGYEKRDAEFRVQLEKVRADYTTKLEQQQKAGYEESSKYQKQLADIKSRKPAPSVWVCNKPASVSTDTTTNTASRPNGGAPQGLPQEGRDVGAPLFAIADDADALAAQLESLQSWVKSVCSK